MDEEQFKKLSEKLDKIIKLFSLAVVKGIEAGDQILMLSSFGFKPAEIADFLGKTPNAVRIALHRARKKVKKKSAEK